MEVSNLQGQLSQKERLLLEDLKSEEELCVVKYRNYAQQAQDPQLSQLFSGIADVEQGHYDTVNQLLQSGGQSSGQQGQGGQPGGQMNQATGNISLPFTSTLHSYVPMIFDTKIQFWVKI